MLILLSRINLSNRYSLEAYLTLLAPQILPSSLQSTSSLLTKSLDQVHQLGVDIVLISPKLASTTVAFHLPPTSRLPWMQVVTVLSPHLRPQLCCLVQSIMQPACASDLTRPSIDSRSSIGRKRSRKHVKGQTEKMLRPDPEKARISGEVEDNGCRRGLERIWKATSLD